MFFLCEFGFICMFSPQVCCLRLVFVSMGSWCVLCANVCRLVCVCARVCSRLCVQHVRSPWITKTQYFRRDHESVVSWRVEHRQRGRLLITQHFFSSSAFIFPSFTFYSPSTFFFLALCNDDYAFPCPTATKSSPQAIWH